MGLPVAMAQRHLDQSDSANIHLEIDAPRHKSAYITRMDVRDLEHVHVPCCIVLAYGRQLIIYAFRHRRSIREMFALRSAQAPSRVAGARKASILNRLALGDFQSSTKIEALREELHRMLAKDPSAKALVFSQFTSMLDLIFFRLQQVGDPTPDPHLTP